MGLLFKISNRAPVPTELPLTGLSLQLRQERPTVPASGEIASHKATFARDHLDFDAHHVLWPGPRLGSVPCI